MHTYECHHSRMKFRFPGGSKSTLPCLLAHFQNSDWKCTTLHKWDGFTLTESRYPKEPVIQNPKLVYIARGVSLQTKACYPHSGRWLGESPSCHSPSRYSSGSDSGKGKPSTFSPQSQSHRQSLLLTHAPCITQNG